MSEHRKALEDIMHICASGRTYTRRQQAIHDVAMKALGMTHNQRHERHLAVFDRIGEDPIRDAYLARRAKREAKYAEYLAEQNSATKE